MDLTSEEELIKAAREQQFGSNDFEIVAGGFEGDREMVLIFNYQQDSSYRFWVDRENGKIILKKY